jgi:putative addiction module component (TIGR02574 family)
MSMTDKAAKLLEEALRLPPEARAAIAGRLMESLEEDVDEDAEAAWAREIERRLEDVDSGKVVSIPWAEARRRILGGGDEPCHR